MNRSRIPDEPMLPVIYMRFPFTLSHKVRQASIRESSPQASARSAMALYMYMARTAWPSAVFCSRTGRWDWEYKGS